MLKCSARVDMFGEHGGRQFRSPKYMHCGCDAGYCEEHAQVNPFGPRMEPGEPRKCRKHRAQASGEK